MGQMDNAFQAQQDAIGATLPEQQALYDMQAQVAEQRPGVIESSQTALQQSNAQFDAEYGAARQEYEARRAELEAAEPKTFWAKADTGEKLGMSLALILGGIAGGGKSNAAVDAMNNAIEMDWRQQQSKIERGLKGLEARRADMGEIMNARQRAAVDIGAYQSASLAKIDAQLAAFEPRVTSLQAKQKIAEARADLQTQKANLELKLQNDLAGTVQTKVQAQRMMEGKGEISYDMLPKDVQSASKIITDKNANIMGIRGQLASALAQWDDPSLTDEDRLRVGQGLIKTLNSTEGADAVGAEEAKRIASELQGNVKGVATLAAQGAAAGAAGGGLIAGVGALPGGIIGGVTGTVMGLVDASNDPGGLRWGPNIEGFRKRIELTRDKLDAAVKRNDLAAGFIRKGDDPLSAMQKADTLLEKSFQYRAKKAD
jgi:hypothetical protein